MEKKDWRWRLYKLLVYIDVDCGEQELGFAIGMEGVEKLEKLVESELDKAREEGYERGRGYQARLVELENDYLNSLKRNGEYKNPLAPQEGIDWSRPLGPMV